MKDQYESIYKINLYFVYTFTINGCFYSVVTLHCPYPCLAYTRLTYGTLKMARLQ